MWRRAGRGDPAHSNWSTGGRAGGGVILASRLQAGQFHFSQRNKHTDSQHQNAVDILCGAMHANVITTLP
jgi:hypothetical protein